MRKKLDIAPPLFDAQSTPRTDANIIIQEREYKLITPLFGGGANPGERDQVTTIRGSEIRGQLRFWWRACRGGQFASLQKMKEAEDRIWGKAHKKADEEKAKEEILPTVQINIDVTNKGEKQDPFLAGQNKEQNSERIPKYAAFPLQPDQKDKKKNTLPKKFVYKNIAFHMILSFPKAHKQEIEAALWAWETFGGIGARTRRGFGALQLLTVNGKKAELPDSDSDKVRKWISDKLKEHVVPESYNIETAHLAHNLDYRIIKADTPYGVWNALINKLSFFRQQRTSEQKWPETKAIRDLLNNPTLQPYHRFPKAAFGLPIVFQMQEKIITLERAEKGHERLASPLILKPLACSNGKAVGLAVLLKEKHTLPPNGLHLILPNVNLKPLPVSATLDKQQLSKLSFLHNNPNIMQVFLEFIGGR